MATIEYDEENLDYAEDEEIPESQNGVPSENGKRNEFHVASFRDLFLKPELLAQIYRAGFEYPSEVQVEVLPQALMGRDIICQAKSGMGKTAVFVISTLQELDAYAVKENAPAVLVLEPTRELAFQTASQYKRFKTNDIRLALFFGGLSIERDLINCRKPGPIHIVVSTPGRLIALVREKAIDLSQVKHFIIDECDKMLDQLDMRADVQKIFTLTPADKQVMLFSATVPHSVLEVCRSFTKNPQEVIVKDETELVLSRLTQHYCKLSEKEKSQQLMNLLDLLEFNQIIIFVNTVERSNILCQMLTDANHPVIMINSSMDQEQRLARYHQFRSFTKRIMVATDLFGRGMDFEHVNVVVNYDTPLTTDTYLHRIARAGRFDHRGLALTFICCERDSTLMNSVQDRFDLSIQELPDELDPALYAIHPTE